MISRSTNRVQAIKSKFENLKSDTEELIARPKNVKVPIKHLSKQGEAPSSFLYKNVVKDYNDKENSSQNLDISLEREKKSSDSDSSDDALNPNPSYLHNKSDVRRSLYDVKKSLSRQTSDPGKKLHRSHAFRCDRIQKLSPSPKRHDSCKGRSETSDFALKGEKRLSKDRLKRLGDVLEGQMKKENFSIGGSPEKIKVTSENEESNVSLPYCSISDKDVPQHILDQYAKVIKSKNKSESPTENKQDALSDSGVSSETENLDDDRCRLKKLKDNDFNSDSNLPAKLLQPHLINKEDEVSVSSETIRLEKKNPHLVLTDTLKKALKQPLPPGPPPKKPPRVFASSPIPEGNENVTPLKKDPKKMLEKLEKVLQQRESLQSQQSINQSQQKPASTLHEAKVPQPEQPTQNKIMNVYDIAETNLRPKPSEIHYLCTNILDITQRTLLLSNDNASNNTSDVIKKCFTSFNCAMNPKHISTTSLPYTKLSDSSLNTNSLSACFCNTMDKQPPLSSFSNPVNKSEFYIPKDEHNYDVPFAGNDEKANSFNSATSEKQFRHSSVNYGVVKCEVNGMHSRSMDNLKLTSFAEDEKIYDIPCNSSPEPETISKPKFEFDKVRSNFETGFQSSDTEKPSTQNNEFQTIENGISTKQDKTIENVKPVPLKPKPVLVKMASDSKMCKSSENLSEEFRAARKNIERKIATESRRYQKKERNASALSSGIGMCIAKKDRKDQLDVDRENLNRLMNEIYETVSAACRMDEQRPSKFPTESDNTSEDSIKLTRSLTEKRKNYVRRVSSRAACLDPKSRTRFRHQTSICSYKSEILENNPYSTFRSWKSFRTSQGNVNKMADVDRRDSTDSKFNLTDSSGNLLSMKGDMDLSMDNLSLDDKAGCLDIELPFEPRERGLFHVCLLVGLNYMTGQAYVKSVFPSQVPVPPHIENLIFPETLSAESPGPRPEYEQAAEENQTYSLVLTDEKGERNYGYCRRVLPEGATCCLPLCYCIIGRYRAPGFYYKVLKEIESHHGSSDIEMNIVLQQLFETDFPNPGEEITLQYTPNNLTLTDLNRSKTLPDQRRSVCVKTNNVSECYDVENNNSVKKVLVSVQSVKVNLLKRPIEPRVDEAGLSVLLDTLGAGLLIKVFGSLLLERKVVLISDSLSQLSGCMEGLQQILYPFVWQQPLISVVPEELRREVLEAPLPILAGCLRGARDEDQTFEEGMLIDITGSAAKVLCFQGDESTILPAISYKTLKTTLQMESSRNQQKVDREDGRTRNVFISEAFLRFFIDVLSDFTRFFVVREMAEGELGKGNVVFEKEAFLKSASSKQNQYFLEWFTETAMFNHFVQNTAVSYHARSAPSSGKPVDHSTIGGIVDAPLPNFYELFEERLTRNNKKSTNKSLDNNSKSNYKSAMNKKVKLLKSKLRDLVT